SAGRHVAPENVYEAIQTASDGPVAEGSVGGGTGMICCDFKAGIGTSSRKLQPALGGYTVGVLVMNNFGHMRDLRIAGFPVGPIQPPAPIPPHETHEPADEPTIAEAPPSAVRGAEGMMNVPLPEPPAADGQGPADRSRSGTR